MNKIVVYVYFALLVLNSLIAFIMYFTDKRKAIKGEERTKEKNLFLIAILNGGIGAVLGSILCHHKSNKIYFVIVNFTCLLLQLGVGALLIYKGGFLG